MREQYVIVESKMVYVDYGETTYIRITMNALPNEPTWYYVENKNLKHISDVDSKYLEQRYQLSMI